MITMTGTGITQAQAAQDFTTNNPSTILIIPFNFIVVCGLVVVKVGDLSTISLFLYLPSYL